MSGTYRPSIAERIAWTSGQLSASDIKVLVALWSCGDYETGRNCRMYVSTLVSRSGLSRATVMRTLARLRDRHQPGGPWILAARRHRHATRYDICLDRLATHPPKEQQMTMAPTIAPLQFESQIETLIEFESQNEMQPTKSESQFETPTSDPDLVPVRTLTPRAREDDATTTAPELPLLGTVPPTKCAHPHKHAWCDGRVHVPRDLHFEFFERLNTLPGETPTQKAGRLVAFYAATMAALPATQAVGDPYAFWKTAYVAWVRTLNETATVEHTPASPPYDLVWQQIRARIETKVNRHTFETWFRPLVMVTDGGSFIEVAARGLQSPIFADWITKQYADVVRAAVTEVRPGTRLDVIDVSPARIAAEYDRQRRSGT